MTREEAISVLKLIHTEENGIVREPLNMAIKALETVEEFEKAQIIMGGRLNGRTYAYKCGLEDGKRKSLDKIRAEIEDLTYYCCEIHPRNVIDDVFEIIDKYKAEREE